MANIGLVTEWYWIGFNDENFKEFCSLLSKGDIVQMIFYCMRYTFSKFAICTVDGEAPRVVHRFGDPEQYPSKESRGYETGSVQEVLLETLLDGVSFRINNARDKVSKPKDVPDIVHYAMSSVCSSDNGQFGQYQEISNNCRHFVQHVRYPPGTIDNRLNQDHCSPWYTIEDKELFYWLVHLGDIIELNLKDVSSIWRFCVRPLLSYSDLYSLPSFKGVNEIDENAEDPFMSLEELAKDRRFRINNSLDSRFVPLIPSEDFLFLLGYFGIGRHWYHPEFSSWQCAMYCRYGWKALEVVHWCSPWCSSAEEFRPPISVGDIIAFIGSKDDGHQFYDWAVCLGTRVEGQSSLEVAYRDRSKDSLRKTVILRCSLEDFFDSIGRKGEFCIQNVWDKYRKPKNEVEVVKSVLQADGREDPCLCDVYLGQCPHFVIGARYGQEIRAKEQKIVSGWCAAENVAMFETEVVKEGDILEVVSGPVNHFAIYVGNGMVVDPCGCDDIVGIVPLIELVKDGIIRVSNFWDAKHKPWIGKTVAKKAKSAVGRNKYGHACFDFVCKMRYKYKFLKLRKSSVAY